MQMHSMAWNLYYYFIICLWLRQRGIKMNMRLFVQSVIVRRVIGTQVASQQVLYERGIGDEHAV